MQAISIAKSGLNAAAARLAASAANVANAESNGPISPTPSSQDVGPSNSASSEPVVYQPIRSVQSAIPGGGVQVSTASMLPSYSEVHEPSAPYADSRGMVASRNVDLVSERIEQIAAKQAYEANLATLNTANEMQRTLINLRT